MIQSWNTLLDDPVRGPASTRTWKSVLIPLDGSAWSTRALARTRRLLDLEGISVTLLRVIECEEGRANDLGYQLDSRHHESRDALAGIRNWFLDRSRAVGAELRFGDPATEILRQIAEGNHDLVLMSTYARPGLGRSLFGRVAQRVLHATPVPLLLFRPRPSSEEGPSHPEEPAATGFKRLLVALDGSESAEEILPEAQKMARTLGSTVHLFRAVSGRPKEASEWERAEEYLRTWERRLSTEGIPSIVHVRTGNAAESAVTLIRECGIDSLALTTHARRGLARSVHGSVLEEIIRETDVPALTLCDRSHRLLLPPPALEHRQVRIE